MKGWTGRRRRDQDHAGGRRGTRRRRGRGKRYWRLVSIVGDCFALLCLRSERNYRSSCPGSWVGKKGGRSKTMDESPSGCGGPVCSRRGSTEPGTTGNSRARCFRTTNVSNQTVFGEDFAAVGLGSSESFVYAVLRDGGRGGSWLASFGWATWPV